MLLWNYRSRVLFTYTGSLSDYNVSDNLRAENTYRKRERHYGSLNQRERNYFITKQGCRLIIKSDIPIDIIRFYPSFKPEHKSQPTFAKISIYYLHVFWRFPKYLHGHLSISHSPLASSAFILGKMLKWQIYQFCSALILLQVLYHVSFRSIHDPLRLSFLYILSFSTY